MRFYQVVDPSQVNPPAPPGMAFVPAGPFQMGDNLDGDIFALPLHTNYVFRLLHGQV